MNAPIWELRGVGVTFRSGLLARRAHPALRGIDLAVAPGERLAIIGESGSGKTTLARVGLGLVRPDAGTVHLLGADRTRASGGEWRALRSRAQLLFQDPGSMLNAAFPIGASLRESARLHRAGEDPRALVDEILHAVGLGGRGRALPSELSGGERRRAGLARVLLARPSLLVADEPTAGLDAALKADLLELMLERAGPDCAVVVISHDLPLVLFACTRVVVMQAGRIVDDFRPEALAGHAPHPATAALLAAAGLR
jgi:peptide/nickel transport system ATP-binding protein